MCKHICQSGRNDNYRVYFVLLLAKVRSCCIDFWSFLVICTCCGPGTVLEADLEALDSSGRAAALREGAIQAAPVAVLISTEPPRSL